jgi:hypothetical protein
MNAHGLLRSAESTFTDGLILSNRKIARNNCACISVKETSMKKFVLILLSLSILPGCGPGRAEVRRYLAGSSHRSIAVLPFDRLGGQQNDGSQIADLMSAKLQRIGFWIADRKKTRDEASRSAAKNNFFEEPAPAAALGAQLGVQAVVVGAIDNNYEVRQNQAAVYSFETIPPPPCCVAVPRTCGSHPVYDPLLQANVDSCSARHRRITVSPAVHNRAAGLSARMRVIDVATQNILWEGSEEDRAVNDTLYHSADRVTDRFSERMLEDFMKGNL